MCSLRSRTLALVLFALVWRMVSAQPAVHDEADRLYANRTDLASAKQASDLWRAALQRNPRDYDTLIKLARAAYWLGGHVAEHDRVAAFEDGVAHARMAISIDPNRPDGYFWLAADLGGLSELSRGAGLRNRTPIREALETVLKIDPGYLQGSADRALGRFFARVPRLFGGSKKEAEAHLRASLMYNPNSTASHFFLADLYADDGRRNEARAEAQRVLDAPLDPVWGPEDQEFKMKAKALLATLK